MFNKPFYGAKLKGGGWLEQLRNRSATSRLVADPKGGKYCGGCSRCGGTRIVKGGCMRCMTCREKGRKQLRNRATIMKRDKKGRFLGR